MANTLYPKYKEALLDGASNTDLNDGDVRVILIDTADYTYSAAHDFLDDVPVAARVATSGALANTSVANGVFDADDITLTSVSGDGTEAVIFYIHTGNEATARLVAYIDTSVGITPNGGNINIAWHASGIFAL